MKFKHLVAPLLFLLCATLQAKEPEYSFGVLNQRSPTLTAQYWNPMLRYVSEVSGVALRLKMGRTAQETTAMTRRGEFDFLYSNHIFNVENRAAGYRVFARPDEKPVQGQLVVLADSPVRTLADLADKEVVFANPNAFLGYFVPMDALLQAKVSVKALFSVNQEAAMGQLKAGRVVAAGVNSDVMADFAEREKISYRVVWSSKGFLGLPLAALPSIPREKVNAVRDAFVKMGSDPEGIRILRETSELIKQKPLAGFVAATDKDYQNIVEFYRTALVKGQ
jgi:phosphonate transport system substrate-binding protein